MASARLTACPGPGSSGAPGVFGLNNMEWGQANDAQTIQQVAVTLWYRPIQAIKFGLQYEYANATFFNYATSAAVLNTVANPTNRSNFGTDHRVEFVGFFYF